MILCWKKQCKATFSPLFGLVSLRELLKGFHTRQIHLVSNNSFGNIFAKTLRKLYPIFSRCPIDSMAPVVSKDNYWVLTSLGPIRFRAGAVTGLAEMELTCLRSGRVFTFVQWKQFELGYLVFRAGQSKMQAMAIENKQTRWRQRPKGHSLEHLTYDFHFLNPRYCSNYLDEDFVRRSKAVAIKSDAKCVSKHVLFRYCIAATLRWTGMVPE